MSDNRKQWDDWREAEDAILQRKSVSELHSEGYAYYRQVDFQHAISKFRQASELAEKQGDLDGQCEDLHWEGHCLYRLGKLKAALERLLLADHLEGGDRGVRFEILKDLFRIAADLPLPCEEQEAILKKLAPYKGPTSLGGSKSCVLYCESIFLYDRGLFRESLDRAQEAFVSQMHQYPSFNDSVYYRQLVNCYRKNHLLPEAWKTLRDWKANGSTYLADYKAKQLYSEAQLLYTEGKLNQAWDVIQQCRAEEQYLGYHGQTGTSTLRLIIRIASDLGRPEEARSSLPLLFRWINAESLYRRYYCFYYFAYYYAALSRRLRNGGSLKGSKYSTPAIAHDRAERCYRRAERIGVELDKLLETDVHQKELDELRKKL